MAQHAHGKVVEGKPSERRFCAEASERSNIQALIGGIGVATLGAASYAAWVAEVPMPSAPYLFGAGVLGVIAATLISERHGSPIRVGDAGVALERGETLERMGWYEITSVSLESPSQIVVQSAHKRIVAPTTIHAAAAAWILKEALARVPTKVTVPTERGALVLRAADEPGQLLAVDAVQVAGRRCKACNVAISFEQDARSCARCGEVYDKKHVPERCLTCDAAMSSHAAYPEVHLS